MCVCRTPTLYFLQPTSADSARSQLRGSERRCSRRQLKSEKTNKPLLAKQSPWIQSSTLPPVRSLINLAPTCRSAADTHKSDPGTTDCESALRSVDACDFSHGGVCRARAGSFAREHVLRNEASAQPLRAGQRDASPSHQEQQRFILSLFAACLWDSFVQDRGGKFIFDVSARSFVSFWLVPFVHVQRPDLSVMSHMMKRLRGLYFCCRLNHSISSSAATCRTHCPGSPTQLESTLLRLPTLLLTPITLL